MKRTCLAIGLFLGAADVAPAADLSSAAYDWSGFSAGLFGGWQSANLKSTELHTDAFGGGWWFPPGPNPDFEFDGDDGFYGMQIGWDRQYDGFVFGIGAEFGNMNIAASIEDPNAPPSPFPDGKPVTSFSGELYGSLTGRVGVAADRLLFFARGGVALLDAEASTLDTCARGPCGILVIDAKGQDVLFGVTAGAGLEYAISGGIGLGAEYRLFHFGDVTVSGIASNLETYRQKVSPGLIHSARLTLNFRF
jgi:outer membrane immunogenic protein